MWSGRATESGADIACNIAAVARTRSENRPMPLGKSRCSLRNVVGSLAPMVPQGKVWVSVDGSHSVCPGACGDLLDGH